MEPHARLGELLTRVKLVTAKDVTAALDRMREHGGRLGENLVAIGAIREDVLDGFIRRIPSEPKNILATGVPDTDLLALLMKLIYVGRLEKAGQCADAIKLPQSIVMDLLSMAVERQLLYALGSHNSDTLLDMRYALTDEGRRWTQDALQRSGYVGPAPVTIEDFVERVSLQKPTNECITAERVHEAIKGLLINENIVERIGPALNSGRAILLYGPPGNGKTSVAMRFASMFQDLIYAALRNHRRGPDHPVLRSAHSSAVRPRWRRTKRRDLVHPFRDPRLALDALPKAVRDNGRRADDGNARHAL